MFRAAFILALPLLAVATPFATRQDAASCPGGASISCCEDMYEPKSTEGQALLKAAKLQNSPHAYSGRVATGCNTGIGILDSPSCGSTPVCCEAEPGSLITLGCLPVIL